MKTWLIPLYLFFTIPLFAQTGFEGLDVSGCLSNIVQDPFFENPCLDDAWGVSHGSPWIVGSSLSVIQMCSGTGFSTSSGNVGSEGLLYRNDFFEGHKYILRATLSVLGNGTQTADEVFIRLVTDELSPTTQPETSRSFLVPGVQDFQNIFFETNFNTGSSTIDIEIPFIPNQDYTQLWMSLSAAQGGDGSGNIATVCFSISSIEIECCIPEKTFTGTEISIIPGLPQQHQRLPEFTHTSDRINYTPSVSDILIIPGEDIEAKAGTFILIAPSDSISFADNEFFVQEGGIFFASIESCDCGGQGNDICANYIAPGDPPGTNVGGFEYLFFPNVFDPSGGNGLGNALFAPLYGNQYIMPYNAYRAVFRIFDAVGGLAHEQELEDQCNGLTAGILAWDGCIDGRAAEVGVYTWTLELENCHLTAEFAGDVLLYSRSTSCDDGGQPGEGDKPKGDDKPGDTIGELPGDLPGFHELIWATDVGNPTTLPLIENEKVYQFLEESLTIFPNPSANDITVNYSLIKDQKVDFTIFSLNGAVVKQLHQEGLKGYNEININLSNIPQGTYFVQLSYESGEIIREKIIKI